MSGRFAEYFEHEHIDFFQDSSNHEELTESSLSFPPNPAQRTPFTRFTYLRANGELITQHDLNLGYAVRT